MVTDTKTKAAPKPKTATCNCGCKGTTKGGRFLPGHDAKLKSRLVTKAKAGDAKAISTLKEFGWTKFIPALTSNGNGKATSRKRATAK